MALSKLLRERPAADCGKEQLSVDIISAVGEDGVTETLWSTHKELC